MITVWKRWRARFSMATAPVSERAFAPRLVGKEKKFDWDYSGPRCATSIARTSSPNTATRRRTSRELRILTVRQPESHEDRDAPESLVLERLQWGLNAVLAQLRQGAMGAMSSTSCSRAARACLISYTQRNSSPRRPSHHVGRRTVADSANVQESRPMHNARDGTVTDSFLRLDEQWQTW